MPSYKFDGRDINVKSFNTVYVLTNISNVDLKRVVLSAPVIFYKNDELYAIGYKTKDSQVIFLYLKSPIICHSNRVRQCDEHSVWKMGLDISKDKEWIEIHLALWKEIEEQSIIALGIVVQNDVYINKLSWSRDSIYLK